MVSTLIHIYPKYVTYYYFHFLFFLFLLVISLQNEKMLLLWRHACVNERNNKVRSLFEGNLFPPSKAVRWFKFASYTFVRYLNSLGIAIVIYYIALFPETHHFFDRIIFRYAITRNKRCSSITLMFDYIFLESYISKNFSSAIIHNHSK